ncbi:aminotransferase class I/II-fold pyridoxal phosphate-dependent enzyme [Baaleninema simplex]|uniref:aminotransferase class I/II-fold pyridoxal phosphate-dependent enzyme n=1 Tax=Baaleninema simplex TaxID=2862350 RepID=UPI0035C8AE74
MVQHQTPFIDALKQQSQRYHTAFYLPGHKQGRGISKLLKNWWGNTVFQADLPELPELDNLFNPDGVIQEAQHLAADAFGASQTWFLANGSTTGIIAAILATCSPGDKILLPRNVHKSVISGTILAGAVPIFVETEYHPHWNIALKTTPETLEFALNQHSDIRAVLIVSPTYHGVCSDIEAISQLCHRRNLPLIVDEAHGAHFHFHPNFPKSAIASDADLAIQSTHKTLSALSQASMLHLKGNRVEAKRIDRALSLVRSTSPNALLLASLDAARHQIATEGFNLLQHTLTLTKLARQRLSQLPDLEIFESSPPFDTTRLTVSIANWGLTGYTADESLHEQFGVTCELPELQHLTFAITLGNTSEDIDRLVTGFEKLRRLPHDTETVSHVTFPPIPSLALSPREAHFAKTETVALHESLDRVCAEIVCPYPPGIPALIPGERISAASISYIEQIVNSGGSVTGLAAKAEPRLTVVA